MLYGATSLGIGHMMSRYYRSTKNRHQVDNHSSSRLAHKAVKQSTSGEVSLSFVSSLLVRHSLVVTAALYVVGYTKSLSLSWLFGTPFSAFRLPLEETIAQGGMAAAAVVFALTHKLFGALWGFAAVAIVALVYLLRAISKNYFMPLTERKTKVLAISARRKKLLTDWSDGSSRGLDLLNSFMKIQVVALVPIALGVASAIVVYNAAKLSSIDAIPTVSFTRSGKLLSIHASLVGEDDDRVFVFKKGMLYVINKTDLVAIRQPNSRSDEKVLRSLQHTGLLPRTD
jgi:hypothetical protein